MVASDDINGSNGSTPMIKPKRTRSGPMFRAWSFQVTVQVDLSHGTSAQAKARLLSEQNKQHRFPQCRNLSIVPPGNRFQEAEQATQSSVPTVQGSPCCMCSERSVETTRGTRSRKEPNRYTLLIPFNSIIPAVCKRSSSKGLKKKQVRWNVLAAAVVAAHLIVDSIL